MLQTFRAKITLWLLLVSSVIIIIIVFLSDFYYNKKQKIEDYSFIVSGIYIHSLKNFTTQHNLLYQKSRSGKFYSTSINKQLSTHKEFIKNSLNQIEQIHNTQLTKKWNLVGNISHLKNLHYEYDSIFKCVASSIKKRGYKDWGIIGKMRVEAHFLENSKLIPLHKILQLRRHEKDYLIRLDDQYYNLFIKECKKLEEYIKNLAVDPISKKELLFSTSKYLEYFKKVASINNKIGYTINEGLQKDLAQLAIEIEHSCDRILHITNYEKERTYIQMKRAFLLVTLTLLVISIFISLFIAKTITKPITELNTLVNDFVKSNFTIIPAISTKSRFKEIKALAQNFSILNTEVQTLIHGFREKLKKGTVEIIKQKNKIELQKEEITTQRDDLEHKKNYIEQQKNLLEKQNKKMLDSIQYAKLIQDSYLPDDNLIKNVLGEAFVFYLPKDIVSGDFYFADKIYYKQEELVLFSVADCTGHGVPGALMSITGQNLIRQAIKEKNVTKPSDVLDHINQELIKHLTNKSFKSTVNDGIDIAFCLLNKKKKTLEYSGALRPLYIIRKNRVIRYRPNNYPIGTRYNKNFFGFTNNSIKLKKNDSIYLFTDGFVDQFGGEKRKKYSSRRFKDLLLKNYELPVEEQKQHFKNTFNQWKGQNEQIDDVLILGYKFK